MRVRIYYNTTAVTTAVSQIYYCNNHYSSCATKYMFLCRECVRERSKHI